MTYLDNIRRVVPYTPGEQPVVSDIIKLNTNENPYPPAPGVYDALKTWDATEFRKYPEPNIASLRRAIGEYHGVDAANVFVGVGSDDVLAMSFMTFFNSDKPVVFPDITYSFYDVWCDLLKIPYKRFALDENFEIVKGDYVKAPSVSCADSFPRGEACEFGGVVIPNPNAPTGVAEPVSFFEDIIKAHPECVVIIDEAYVDFGADTCLPLVEKYPNVVVVRTFSKSRSLAGSRIGYAIGPAELIKYLHDVKFSYNSYTLDNLTMAMGIASVKDELYFKETVAKVVATREWTKKELSRLGFSFPDSKTNFIFASPSAECGKTAGQIFDYLKSKNIFVRYWNSERIKNNMRISIGTDEEMKKLIETLEDYLCR